MNKINANILTSTSPSFSSTKTELQASPTQAVQKELVGSEASLASVAYASPQVSFGANVVKTVLDELQSNKSDRQINIKFSQMKKFIEEHLGYSYEGHVGSHARFKKEGESSIIIVARGDKEVLRPEAIAKVRKHIQQ